jgi:hypothetical protein
VSVFKHDTEVPVERVGGPPSALPPHLVAATDQLGAALASLAPAVRQYRDALLAEGFTEPEAVALCADLPAALLRQE